VWHFSKSDSQVLGLSSLGKLSYYTQMRYKDYDRHWIQTMDHQLNSWSACRFIVQDIRNHGVQASYLWNCEVWACNWGWGTLSVFCREVLHKRVAQILTREFTRHVKYKHDIEINTKSLAQTDQSSNHCPKVTSLTKVHLPSDFLTMHIIQPIPR
jgi:hypothetical protein